MSAHQHTMSPSVPQQMRAVVVQPNKDIVVEEQPVPKLQPNEVLIRIMCAGLNPTDYKHLDYNMAKPGVYVGCDYVGEVVDMGSAVPDTRVKRGEMRWNFTRGCQGKKGAFAEYITSDWDLTSLVPPNVTPQQAASFPIPLLTAVQALYLPARLNLPEPPVSKPSKEWILIWGGSTSVGIYAIQLAKLSGLRVATTASPKKWEYLRSLGADYTVDYKDPEVIDKLKEATTNSLQYGLDCVTNRESYRKAAMVFRPDGGKLITTLFDLENPPRPEVKTIPTLVYTGLGEDHEWPPFKFPSDPSHRDLHARWAKKLTQIIGEGKIKPMEVKVIGGLDDVKKGLDMLRQGKHEAKLVVNVVPN